MKIPATSETTAARFRGILDLVRRRVSRPHFETWFDRATLGRLSDDELVLRLPNRFLHDWVSTKYRAHVVQAASEYAGHPVAVRFEMGPPEEGDASASPPAPDPSEIGAAAEGRALAAAPTAPATPHVPASAPAVREPQAPFGSETASYGAFAGSVPEAPGGEAAPGYSFDNFVVGASNQMAHAAAKAVADAPGRTYNPLFLYGSVGLGKTHLLQAICGEIRRRAPQFRIVYLSCEQFTNEFVSALKTNATEGFRRRFRDVDMLVIDDIHFLASKERTQEEFFHTFNALYQARKQIILSSDAGPSEIPTLEERLVSRFKWGLVERLEQPETETRMAIIRRKAEATGLDLPDDVVEYIANAVRSNIREIEGAIASVRSRASIDGVPVSLALARLSLEPSLRGETQSISLDKITQVVAAHFGVKVGDLRSKKRTMSVSLPRQVVMHLARELTALSLGEIGDHFGGRDHTTVLYAITKIRARIEAEDAFKTQVARLTDRLHAR